MTAKIPTLRLSLQATLMIAVALGGCFGSAAPARAGMGPAHRHHLARYHRHGRYGRIDAAGNYFGPPRYAPPAPISVGLFGTGLFSGEGLFGFGVFGF